MAGNEWPNYIGGESLNNSKFEYDCDNAIDKMNYTKMSDCCRLTSKLDQLSRIVRKTLYTSIKGLKGAILSLEKTEDINNGLLMNCNYMLVDILMQNLKSDSRIHIMGHTGLDTDPEKAIDSMRFVRKFKSIVGMILKEENRKRKIANMPGTILGELKNEFPDDSNMDKLNIEEQSIPLKSRVDQLQPVISGTKGQPIKTLDLSDDFSDLGKVQLSKAKEETEKVKSRQPNGTDYKSIALPTGQLALEAIIQHDHRASKTGKSIISKSLLTVSHVFKSILGETNTSFSGCFVCKSKKRLKVHALPSFYNCIQDYIEEENRDIVSNKQNNTYLKNTKASSRSKPINSKGEVVCDKMEKLVENDQKNGKYPSTKCKNYAEESKCIFETSNGSVIKRCISMVSNLNIRKDHPESRMQISPIPSQVPRNILPEVMPSVSFNMESAISVIKSGNFTHGDNKL